jgi:ribosomal protein L2
MAYKLQTTRTAQWPLVAEFEFNVGDTIANTSGSDITIGTTVASQVFNVCKLPAGARVSAVEFFTITAFDGGTVAASLGTAASATKYVTSSPTALMFS